MNILVAGCSFSTGHGFAGSIHDPRIWPNILGKDLDATVKNVAVSGYDNTGIFLNALRELSHSFYDLILIQITALGRIVLSPNIHGIVTLPTGISIGDAWKDRVDQKQHIIFSKHFTLLNGNWEHWNRMMSIILTAQNLLKGHNLRFVNGLLDWNKDFFDNQESNFSNMIIDIDQLPDRDIQQARSRINRDKQLIDLDLWINPFQSLNFLKIDSASDTDAHPGPESQKEFAKLIYKSL